MHVVVMVLCASNVATRMVLAAFRYNMAGINDEAAAACDAEGKDTRSFSEKKNFQVKESSSQLSVQKCIAVSLILEAAVLVLMAGAFLLFLPACIIMFRRVERKLDAIIQEMNLRSDLGTVFLPHEFSAAAADVAQSQVEMQVVQARSSPNRLKAAATAQRMRFVLCLLLVLAALIAQALHAVFAAILQFVAAKPNPACGRCGSCQDVERLMVVWYENTPQLFLVVVSVCSTLPLMFSLWLMMTKEDREMMLNPGRFRTDSSELLQDNRGTEARLKAERVRMGVELL